jgi:hypothetical protein
VAAMASPHSNPPVERARLGWGTLLLVAPALVLLLGLFLLPVG